MAQDTDYERIARKAHELWESEGRPHGRDQAHWDQAKEIIALHDSMGDTLLPRTSGALEPEEPTQAVEPYGDVPNLTDQGEHDLTAIDREPEVTKPSHAVYTTGANSGHVARPAQTPTPDMDEPETVTPAPKVAAVTPTPSNPTLGTPAPRPTPKTADATPKPAAAPPAASPVGNSAPVAGKASAPKQTAKPSAAAKPSGKPSRR